MKKHVVSGDLEANGLLNQATKIHCGVFKNLHTGEITRFTPDNIEKMLEFLDSVDELIIHNGFGYDLPLIEKLYNYSFKGKVIDTLVVSRLLNPKRIVPYNCPNKSATPHGLESWGYRVGRGKPEHDDWDNYSPAMLHRCEEDVHITELTYKYLFEEEAEKGNWKPAIEMSLALFNFLSQQERYAWKVDIEYMHKCVRQLDKWIERIDKAIVPQLPYMVEVNETKAKGEYGFIRKPFLKSGKPSASVEKWLEETGNTPDVVKGVFSRISFRKIDLNSNAEVKDYLLSQGWEPLEWNYNDNGEITSPKMSKDDPFEGINGKVGKLLAKRVQCRQRKSIIEGLINLIDSRGRISSVVNNLAVTGRATHRNIVNIPKAGSFYGKQMRKFFICGEGKVLVGTDSDSCQLRMLGGRMGSEEYIQAIMTGDKSKGTDLHSLTKRIGELESRDTAKKTMYCLLFGGGDDKLGKTAKKPGKGKQLREALYNGFDGLGDLMSNLEKEWQSTAKKRYNHAFNRMEYYDGTITGLDGRPITVPNRHQLLVYLLQSDEAIMMAAAYIKANIVLRQKYKYGVQFGFVAWYHKFL